MSLRPARPRPVRTMLPVLVLAVVMATFCAGLARVNFASAESPSKPRPAFDGSLSTAGSAVAEQGVLRIRSLSATSTKTGILISATFAGDITQALGRGSLQAALVAAVIYPSTGDAGPIDLATMGAGEIGTTLSKGAPSNNGVVRDGPTLSFFIGGANFANTGRVEVKAFASFPPPPPRSAARLEAASTPVSFWDGVEERTASEEANLPHPSAASSCDELRAMQLTLGNDLLEAEARADLLKRIEVNAEQAIPELEDAVSSQQWARAASVVGVVAGTVLAALAIIVGSVLVAPGAAAIGATVSEVALDSSILVIPATALLVALIRGPANATEKIEALRDEIKSLKLDIRLAQAFSAKEQELIEHISRLQGQIEVLQACPPRTTTTTTTSFACTATTPTISPDTYTPANEIATFTITCNGTLGSLNVLASYHGHGCPTATCDYDASYPAGGYKKPTGWKGATNGSYVTFSTPHPARAGTPITFAPEWINAGSGFPPITASSISAEAAETFYIGAVETAVKFAP